MRVFVMWVLILGLAVSPALAATGEEAKKDAAAEKAGVKPAAPAKAEAKPTPSASALEMELQQLRELLQSQTQDLQAQRAALREQQQKMQALEEQLKLANMRRENLSATAGNPANASNSTVVATNVASTPAAFKEQDKKPDDSPVSIRYKGITITPGGFLVAETVWRQRALSADVNTPFNAIPFKGSSQAHVTEFNASGRQSRITLLGEGKLDNMKLTGYYEMDFLSAGTTSNNNQSNSYTLRQRQIWGQAALNNGWSFTGGQMWSLVTETKKGVQNRTEAGPMTIDAQYTAGFSWARQFGFRVAKNFNDKVALAFSVEGPQTTFAAHGNANNFLIGAPGAGGGLFNATANYTFNASPDFIVKAAFDPVWGHYEVFGVVSVYRSRIFPNATAVVPSAAGATNDLRAGGGGGANARMPFFNKKLDVGLHFFGGDGVGRYGTTGLPDATVRPDGTLALIQSAQALVSLEWHATPKLDIYGYGGTEYADRTFYINAAGKAVGYGAPSFNNTGCGLEVLPTNQNTPPAPTNCTGDTKNITEGTLGFWYRFYKGPRGTLQFGSQYSYAVRSTWAGTGGDPHAIENMVFTSFRYVLP